MVRNPPYNKPTSFGKFSHFSQTELHVNCHAPQLTYYLNIQFNIILSSGILFQLFPNQNGNARARTFYALCPSRPMLNRPREITQRPATHITFLNSQNINLASVTLWGVKKERSDKDHEERRETWSSGCWRSEQQGQQPVLVLGNDDRKAHLIGRWP